MRAPYRLDARLPSIAAAEPNGKTFTIFEAILAAMTVQIHRLAFSRPFAAGWANDQRV
jgi:hypothetical protein